METVSVSETSKEFCQMHGFASEKVVFFVVIKLKAIPVIGRAGP
jgi:hypothetical protein